MVVCVSHIAERVGFYLELYHYISKIWGRVMYKRSTKHKYFTPPGRIRHQENYERQQERDTYRLGNSKHHNRIQYLVASGRRILQCQN